jgi:AraC-like DNA-binding protein
VLSQPPTDAVSVRFFMPSEKVAPYISTYYLTDFAVPEGHVVDDWLHPEWANLRIWNRAACNAAIGTEELQAAPRMIATGPTSLASHFLAGPARAWGIGLLPQGWARFINAPASLHADRFCNGQTDPAFAQLAPLFDRVFGKTPDPAAEAARIDAFFCELLERCPPHEDEAKIRAAHAALIDDNVTSVGELAERLGISSRSLERLSLKAFGFSPKLLLRRQRFLRSLAQFMLDPSLTWIKTLDWHYVDQAHFVRDFRRFMTMSPSAYAALDHPVLRSAARARSVAAGAAVQALHQP